jgi:hypothetical protein
MKIEYEHNTRVVKIDGKDVAKMTTEEKKNAMLIIANHLRTRYDAEAVYVPAQMVAIICGEDVNNVSTVEI